MNSHNSNLYLDNYEGYDHDHDHGQDNGQDNDQDPNMIENKQNIMNKYGAYILLIIPCCGIPYVLLVFDINFLIKLAILFVSFFTILWLFPIISISLYSRPLYIGDIEHSRFEILYRYIMNFILAIGCAILFENWVIRKLMENKSIIEITALVGGNITFFGTLQNYIAKVLLSLCHRCKLQEEARSRRNSQENQTESISDVSTDSMLNVNPISVIHSPLRRGNLYRQFFQQN